MIALIAANAVPLVGVLFLGWKVFPVVLLFWMENVIIGVLNVLKIMLAKPTEPPAMKLFLVPFFCVHYGMFCFVHGFFVVTLFGGPQGAGTVASGLAQVEGLSSMVWALLALAASHIYSFAVNYIGAGEYRRADANQLMSQPYGRVVVLHVAILGGAFILAMLKSPVGGLVLLVVLKTALDAFAHLRERSKFSSPSEPP
ncbi:MAG: hypothetical protein KJ726_10075 [Verrucomicrobia bacterium]|nr:hypothetical protein [Verrucomicrobiota bacterium]MBU1910382.1 hypothetical protein [Verrucomicrobiota bacterium]